MRKLEASAYKTLLAALVLIGMSACVAYEAEYFEDVEEEPGTVWLTIGADTEEVILEAMTQGVLEGTFYAAPKDNPVALLEIPQDQLAPLSELMHTEFRRCGGYMAHESYDTAMDALEQKRVQTAVNQKLVTYNIDNDAAVSTLLPTISQSNIVSIINHMSTAYTNRYHTTPNGTAASNWLRDTWQTYADASGRSDVTVELYNHSTTNQPSVVMTIPGDWNVEEVVVIGGHMDSTVGGGTGPSTVAPGADDNASGTATVSEVARVLLSQGYYPDRTVKFMAYAAEEVGLRGSQDIANDFLAQGVNVVGVLQLDMTNYNGSSQDIVLIDDYTNSEQNAFIGNLIDHYFPTMSWTYSSCGYACSDHASWTFAGYPSSIPFEAQVGQHNPLIHTSSDTLANSDPTGNHTMKFARLAVAFVAELAKGDFADDWTPPAGATAQLFPDALGVYETRHYGPFPVLADSTFDARLDSSGYADVYVRFGAMPTTSEYDCRPYSTDPQETCNLVAPATNTDAYVMVRGYMASYTLRIAFHDSTPPPVPSTVSFPGVSIGNNASISYGPYPVVEGTPFIADMVGIGSGDADLYMRFGSPPTTNTFDCKSTSPNSTENCTRTVPAGETEGYILAYGYSAASYDLSITHSAPAP